MRYSFIFHLILAPLCELYPDPELVCGGPSRRPTHPARAARRDGDGRLEVRPLLLQGEQRGQLGNLVPGKDVKETPLDLHAVHTMNI